MRRFGSCLLTLLLLAACQTDSGADPPPDAPTGLAATAGDGQVSLSWNASTAANLASYRVYRGVQASALTQLASVPAGTEEFTDDSVSNGVTYHYAVSAVDRAGAESARSAVVQATPGSGQETDVVPPEVVRTEPPADSTDVAVNFHVLVAFSEPMQRAATEAAIAITPAVDCEFQWNPTSTSVTCHPAGGVMAKTAYKVAVDQTAVDLAGNGLAAAHTFTFTTGTQELETCVFGDQTFGACVFGR